MTLTLRRGVIAAIAAGLLAALAVALLVPRTDSSAQAPSGDPFEAAPAPSGDPAHPATGPALPQPSGETSVGRRALTEPRIAVRMADPLGGPAWAVRTFRAREGTNVRACAQLGRLLDGRFGWIDATNTWRPAGVGRRGAPGWCGSRRADLGGRPQLQLVTRITDPTPGTSRVIQSVAWGLAGSAGTPALRIDGRPVQITAGADGAFLVAAPADHRPDVALDVTYAARKPAHVEDSYRAGARFYGELFAMVRRGRPRPAQILPVAGAAATIELRLPDPNGGLPWGASAARAEDGGWCTSQVARIVGDRVGNVNYDLGTFTDATIDGNGRCASDGPPLTRARPLRFSTSYASGGFSDLADPLPGRTARRTQRGLTSFTGTARPDVRSITITTPRDVRTVRPSRRSHAFAFVYDGEFPTGDVVLTSTFTDGTTHVDRIPAPPF